MKRLYSVVGEISFKPSILGLGKSIARRLNLACHLFLEVNSFFSFNSYFLVMPHGMREHGSLITRNQTCGLCSGSTESQLLDLQGSP